LFFALPALNRCDAAVEKCRDLLPGFEAVVWVGRPRRTGASNRTSGNSSSHVRTMFVAVIGRYVRASNDATPASYTCRGGRNPFAGLQFLCRSHVAGRRAVNAEPQSAPCKRRPAYEGVRCSSPYAFLPYRWWQRLCDVRFFYWRFRALAVGRLAPPW
jgi:hypothetical protein